MYKILFLISLLYFPIDVYSKDETISQNTARVLNRIYKYMDEEDWENASRELEITAKRYYLNEKSYERALINQLYGQFYALQSDYENATPWFEKAIAKNMLPFAADLQVTYSLAQCYFQMGRFKDVIKTLESYKLKAATKGQNTAPIQLMVLGIAYFQENDLLNSYINIAQANATATKLNEEWLQYEFALAISLKKFDAAINVGQYLIFINPDKKSYWKQLSGVYYGSESEDLSLAGLELAFENNVLDKEKDYLDLARYFMYKELPIKAVAAINEGISKNLIIKNKKNYEFLADAYFLARDRVSGISSLVKAEKLGSDSNLSFKIARFAFENEDWNLAIEYFLLAQSQGWNKYPGRAELLLGITYFEASKYRKALSSLTDAMEYDDSKLAAEGWISYVKDVLGDEDVELSN